MHSAFDLEICFLLKHLFFTFFLCSTILLYLMMMWLTYEIELSLQSRAPFADLIFQKCAETDSSFNIFKWKLSSCYSLAHLLPIGPDHFFTICMWNRALATVLCILSTSSSKSAPRPPVFYDCRALAKVLCAFCLPFSPIEPRTRGNRDPPSATTAASLPEKNTGFCARECFQAWIDAFPISHASQLLACVCHDDWGDDVVAIMVRKLAMTIVRNSEVS